MSCFTFIGARRGSSSAEGERIDLYPLEGCRVDAPVAFDAVRIGRVSFSGSLLCTIAKKKGYIRTRDGKMVAVRGGRFVACRNQIKS